MSDNFDLQKYLKESKALTNQNPFLKESYTEFPRATQGEKGTMAEYSDEHGAIREKIREYILAEIAEEVTTDNADQDDAALNADYDPLYEDEDEEDNDYSDYFFDIDTEEDLGEAKKKKKKEDVEDVEDVNIEDTTDLSIDDLDMGDSETAPETDVPDMPDMGANLDGKEKDIMSHLMKALEIAKSEGNEKVITQISNTLKFFISEYIAQ